MHDLAGLSPLEELGVWFSAFIALAAFLACLGGFGVLVWVFVREARAWWVRRHDELERLYRLPARERETA